MQQTSGGAVAGKGGGVGGVGIGGGGGGGDGGGAAGFHHHYHGHDVSQGLESQRRRRAASVEAEMQRMKHLPSTSSYATHRTRVLGKALELLSIVPEIRSSLSEPEELELLFSSVSL